MKHTPNQPQREHGPQRDRYTVTDAFMERLRALARRAHSGERVEPHELPAAARAILGGNRSTRVILGTDGDIHVALLIRTTRKSAFNARLALHATTMVGLRWVVLVGGAEGCVFHRVKRHGKTRAPHMCDGAGKHFSRIAFARLLQHVVSKSAGGAVGSAFSRAHKTAEIAHMLEPAHGQEAELCRVAGCTNTFNPLGIALPPPRGNRARLRLCTVCAKAIASCRGNSARMRSIVVDV